MSKNDMRRKEIQTEINRIRKQLEDATRSLQGREYVWNRQITARDRLRKDLNEQLRILEEEYATLKGGKSAG